jgi:ribosomal protein L16 Arg81 hydroxylase
MAPASGVVPGRRALRRLVAVHPDDFADRIWDRSPLLSRAAELPRPFDDLLSADAVDEIVSRRGLRTPFLRVARNGSTLPERAYTAGGGTGAGISDQVSDDRLVSLFAEGATMVLQGLHRLWPPLTELAAELAADLAHPVQVNAYVTPPQSRGFDDHYDVHDVFVLQVEGRKRWRIHHPVLEKPLRNQPWTGHRDAIRDAVTDGDQALLDVVLEPGDCLYLPRGFLHAAQALGEVSTHLTIGVHPWTRHHLVEQLVAQTVADLGADEQLRASLPLGADVSDPVVLENDVELVRARLLQALAATPATSVAGRMADADRRTRRAAPVGPLRQLRAAQRLEGDQLLRLRPYLAATLDDGEPPVLRSRAGDTVLAPRSVEPVRALLTGVPMPVDRIGRELAVQLLAAAVLVPDAT